MIAMEVGGPDRNWSRPCASATLDKTMAELLIETLLKQWEEVEAIQRELMKYREIEKNHAEALAYYNEILDLVVAETTKPNA